MEGTLQWIAGLAGLLLALYGLGALPLARRAIAQYKVDGKTSWLWRIASISVAEAFNIAISVLFISYWKWGNYPLFVELLIFGASGVVFCRIPEQVLKFLRGLNDWYLKAKGVDSCK